MEIKNLWGYFFVSLFYALLLFFTVIYSVAVFTENLQLVSAVSGGTWTLLFVGIALIYFHFALTCGVVRVFFALWRYQEHKK
jgi:hypothetical protein